MVTIKGRKARLEIDLLKFDIKVARRARVVAVPILQTSAMLKVARSHRFVLSIT